MKKNNTLLVILSLVFVASTAQANIFGTAWNGAKDGVGLVGDGVEYTTDTSSGAVAGDNDDGEGGLCLRAKCSNKNFKEKRKLKKQKKADDKALRKRAEAEYNYRHASHKRR
jgi:hypothetical protein